jgi:murein L,D-transpeptidase YcbB/YkuD
MACRNLLSRPAWNPKVMASARLSVFVTSLALFASPVLASPDETSSVDGRGAAAAVKTLPDIAPPIVPEAPVQITEADRFQQALAARLGDARASFLRLARKEREAIAAFYALGNYQPLWIKDGAWNGRAQAVIERLRKADEDGLDNADYPVPDLGAKADSAEALTEAELKLSAAAVTYARDARGARIQPSKLSEFITPDLELPPADAVLTRLATAAEPGEALAGFNPPHPGYRALRAKMAAIRAGGSEQSRLESDILANMERWRWLPADLGRKHVWVNVPEFRLRLMREGRAIHEARVIVGKPETPTPLFSDEMDHAVVNPSWYMPPSIFKNEFFSDPAYAAARGYDVIYGRNGGVTVRQPPGERNALGFIKFMFPNRHAVYLHDTPSRNLFKAEKRAFSHGCVRLDQPFRFGEFVLGAEWTEARLRSLIGKGERTIRLPEKIPVHLTYFTLFADDAGGVRQIADLYGVNNKVRVALGLGRDATYVAEKPRREAPRREVRRKPARPMARVVRAPVAPVEPSFWWWTR